MGAIRTRSRGCEGHDPQGEDLSARFGLSFKDERQWGDSFPPLPSSPTSFADLDQ